MNRVSELSGFRCHVLVPHDLVSTITHDEPHGGLERSGMVYTRHGKPLLRVAHAELEDGWTHWAVSALQDVWVQEPGVTVAVAGGGLWRGWKMVGGGKRWVPTSNGYVGWVGLHQRDAHRSTVHWDRFNGTHHCDGVIYHEPVEEGSARGPRWKSQATEHFAQLLTHMPGHMPPWERCQAFDRWPVEGVWEPPKEGHPRLRCELGGYPPDVGQMHWIGWGGFAGAIVNEDGETPEPGSDPGAGDGFNLLADPYGWRLLVKGHTVHELVEWV